MTTPPVLPKIYHITHVNNLASIVADNYVEADGRRIRRGGGQTSIGMTEIKRRRLNEIAVSCHPDTMAGDYVPFYFCPRSIMLYILHMGNHPDLVEKIGVFNERIRSQVIDILQNVQHKPIVSIERIWYY